jgi:hypothetical protein
MEANPFESPTTQTQQPHKRSGLLLRLAAIVCWIGALSTLATMLVILAIPGNLEQDAPALFIAVSLAIVFGLPTLGFALVGCGCWWRSGQLALIGIVAFLPPILAVLVGLVRRL